MRSLAIVLAIAVTASLASAAPRRRGDTGITILSSSDASPGVLDPHARQRHGEILRRALLAVLHRSGIDARHAGIPGRQIDISITAWRVASAASRIDVSTVLRVVICDDQGKMLSIVTGRARVSAPGQTEIAELREQAVAEAVGGMTRSLQSQLDRATS